MKKDSMPPPNVQWHSPEVTREHIEGRLRQRGCVVWLTGLSGAGKSTISSCIQKDMFDRGHIAVVLDGDNVRHGLCNDLGFSASDRTENVRRVAHVAKLFADFGLLVIVALISPYRADRLRAREICEPHFFEVFIRTTLQTCEQRDPKGLYKKARAGEIPDFTGVHAPYEPPETPDFMVDCENLAAEESARELLAFLEGRDVINVKRAWASP